MAKNKDEQWLVVQPIMAADDRLSALLPGLTRLGLDSYSCRQRLIGQAPALLARGRGESLQKISALLATHRFQHWLFAPSPPLFIPQRIFSLRCTEEAIRFTVRSGEAVFPRGAPVVAILADLAGKMTEKQMRRLLAQNAYRGADHLSLATEDEIYREVLRGEPVVDLYLLSASGAPERAVRVFPGRFDPKGLGNSASYSAVGNLEAVLRMVQQSCATRLHTGFGLAALPGCRPRGPEPGVDHRRQSLSALTRYGWLMVDLEKTGPLPSETGEHPAAAAPAEVAATPLAPAQPALAVLGAATGVAVSLPPAEPEEDATTFAPPAEPRPMGLPVPPDRTAGEAGGRWNLLGWSGAGLGMAGAVLLAGGGEFISLLWHQGVQSGLLPALASLLLFFGGAQALRWKRQIENTPTSRVRSLAMGMVEVHGRAVRQYALVSPMSQMACVWYRLRRYRRHRNRWRLASTRSSGAVSFLLDDGTGRVRIEPAGAAVRAGSRHEGTDSSGGILFGARIGGTPDEKWIEEVIAEGTYLYILGYAREKHRTGPSLVERTREKLRLLKGDPRTLRRFDADGDGHISAEEWEMARSAMAQEALRDHLAEGRPQQRQVDQAVIGRPPGRARPFIIAEAESETRLSGRYGLVAAAMLAGGLLLAGWAAAVVLPNFIF